MEIKNKLALIRDNVTYIYKTILHLKKKENLCFKYSNTY